ncbi:hypothetical protein [Streptomyces sp. NPDC093109]|uniref:hypothetical protein n=1 Tax=Streptomyces sp. NPDC093109 TaxID=3154977 RepID=UPI00344E8FC8
MRVTLVDLYARYSARIAAQVAHTLDLGGADPVDDTDDVTQEVWAAVAQIRVLPESHAEAWRMLQAMATRYAVAAPHAAYRTQEIPSGLAAPAVRGLSPRPMRRLDEYPDNTVSIGTTIDNTDARPDFARLAS